ncbi:aspartate carbamoyltransferase catalytic subunit [Marinicella meishanensis]|uniref:aspartate carbamoyltransferase catalytic subunit n=1 Tax=Marinicella meishanensis TaxID=2873263 RepID=UPI001CBBCC08|nr:aspartate carbamoyltransferase catalytic subunit [Marinicella sp. NBU2979]
MKHLTDIKALDQASIHLLFDLADSIRSTPVATTRSWHAGRSAAALFFENSTRTLCSFQMACQRLGVDVTALNIAHSSTQKGESLRDTLLTLAAMQPDLFIVRHPENQIQQRMIDWLPPHIGMINAGDGTHQHPTQGLLDLYTISQHKTDWASLKVTLIGDIKHSRVANSLIDGLKIMGTQQIQLYAPDALIPVALKHRNAPNLPAALEGADVVVMLRIQKERLPLDLDVDFATWHASYGLNSETLSWAKSDAIVLHPGPMNRGIEISDAVADGPQSVILEQVTNGVLIRQALIHHLLSQS